MPLHLLFQQTHFILHPLQRLKDLKQLVLDALRHLQLGMLGEITDPQIFLDIQRTAVRCIKAP